MKITRDEVLRKTDYRCAYCGADLRDKKWHVDHFIPVVRNPYTKKMLQSKNHNLDNLVAACAPCNMNKGSFDIDYWKDVLGRYMERREVKTLMRLGIIKLDNFPIKFHYEKEKQNDARL